MRKAGWRHFHPALTTGLQSAREWYDNQLRCKYGNRTANLALMPGLLESALEEFDGLHARKRP
jgi:hypothetical protein